MQVGNLKAQSQHFLRAKAEAASKAEEQLLALRSRSEAEISALQAEIEHLAVYAERVTEVLRRMEAGVYPIVDKAGVRAFRLPARDRPAALDGTRLNYLMRKGESAQRLLEATQAAAAGPPPSLLLGTGSRVQGGAVSGGSVAGGESMRRGSGEGSRQQQQGSSSSGQGEGAEGDVSSSGAAAGGPAVASPSGQLLAAAVPPGSLGPDLEELRSQWERDMRGLITSQVVSELSSDRTVEYIRSLEVAVARYRTELQQERRRQSEMTVALRSAQRVVSRPGSAIQQVMSGKVITLPPSWGYGHSSGFSPMATRPATAGVLQLHSQPAWSSAHLCHCVLHVMLKIP
jgi:kinesin family protein 7